MRRNEIVAFQTVLASHITALRFMLQRPQGETADPLNGAQLIGRGHGSSLTIGAVSYPELFAEAHHTAGALVTLTLHQRDVSAALGGNVVVSLVMLTRTAHGWDIAQSWPLAVDITAPTIIARAARGADDRILVYIYAAEEDATHAVVSTDQSGDAHHEISSQPWQGLRSAADGSKAWYFSLPPDAPVAAVGVQDTAGNVARAALRAPPTLGRQPTSPSPAWELPHWLRRDGDHAAPILEAMAHGLPRIDAAARQVSPADATGPHLDRHARLYGVRRRHTESDTLLRARALAVLRHRFSSRDGLQAHLSEVAGTPIRISDHTTGVNEGWVRLDGSHTLDATWDLGGPGSELPPGGYLVRLAATPTVPLRWLLDELERLRPVGILPEVMMLRQRVVGLTPRIAGAREITDA